jgi:hypothetical protein
MRRSLLSAAVSALAAACVPSPDPCFVPQSIVTDVRVLGVRADPPEALFDLESGLVETVLVRALVGGQVDGVKVQLRARLCPAADGATACPESAPVLTGPESADGASEGTLTVRVPASLLSQARAADPLKGFGGIRVLLELDAKAGLDHAQAIKTLLFSPKATTPAPNQPIELSGIDFLDSGQLDSSISPTGQLTLLVAQTYGLRPRLAPLPDGSPALEEYDVVDLSGRTVHLREQATYSFYTDPHLIFGDLPRSPDGSPLGVYAPGADVATEPQPGAGDPASGLVRVTPMDAAKSHLWVVARDSRGAVAWAAIAVQSLDQRVCMLPAGVPCPDGQSCCPALLFGCN